MNTALILSGGVGSRLGADIPKQYIKVGGRMILSYCVEQLSMHPQIDAIQIVAQLSIWNGLRDIFTYAKAEDTVLIHDAARPCLSEALITECLGALEGHDGVLPVLPMKDTVYLSRDGKSVSSLLNRQEIFAGQAPELFVLGKYYESNERLLPQKILKVNGSTEPAILAGMDIAMIPGDENNYKITTGTDLKRFREYIEQKSI